MFQRTVLDKLLAGNLLVVADQAVGKAEIELWVGVGGGGAEHEDVAETFSLAVFAFYAVVFVCYSVVCQAGMAGRGWETGVCREAWTRCV